MIGSLGMPEILFILVLALLVFGPKRLPELGRTLGKGLREFRRATSDLKRTVETEMEAADREPERTMTSVKPLATREAEASQAGDRPRTEPAAEGGSVPRAADGPDEPAAESESEPVPEAEPDAGTDQAEGGSRAAE
jgi:TatA/E family protein of Tat protein translocase